MIIIVVCHRAIKISYTVYISLSFRMKSGRLGQLCCYSTLESKRIIYSSLYADQH